MAETEETCQEHIQYMKKEMAKLKNKKLSGIKESMEATFHIRRQSILTSLTTLTVLSDYPALRMVFSCNLKRFKSTYK
jgi:hypothetical protein